MSWGNDDGPKFTSAGKFFKIDEGEEIDIVVLTEALARFRPVYGAPDTEPKYYSEPPRGKEYAVKSCMEVFNLDAGVVQIWETSENNFGLINSAIKRQIKRGAPSFDRVHLRVTKSKGANGFIQYTIMNIGTIDDSKMREIGHAKNAADFSAEEIEGVMSRDEAARLVAASKGGSSLDPSPPPASSAPAADADIPF